VIASFITQTPIYCLNDDGVKMIKYILLVRHGKVDRSQPMLDSEHPLANSGYDICEVACRLAEHLSLSIEDEPIVLGQLWHGSSKAVMDTVKILMEELNRYHVSPIKGEQSNKNLDPSAFWPGVRNERNKRLQEIVRCILQTLEDFYGINGIDKKPNALLIVGHQPQLSWIAAEILHKSLPIDRAEIACLAIRNTKSDWLHLNRWLLWTIAPTDADVESQLRDKIKSKMQLAGIIGSLILFFMGLLLGWLAEPDKLLGLSRVPVYLSLAFFLTSLLLYLATLYAYDRLLMPSRFWGEKVKFRPKHWFVSRPPGSTTWLLYQNMMRIWNWMFTPATWFVILGLLFLMWGVIKPGIVYQIAILVLFIVFAGYQWFFRPGLGTED
jgi:phosphohistidine phosphatase SixA